MFFCYFRYWKQQRLLLRFSNFHWNLLWYLISLQDSAALVFEYTPAIAWYLLKANFLPRIGIYLTAPRTSIENLFSLFFTELIIKSYHWDYSLRFKTVNCSPEPAIVPISSLKSKTRPACEENPGISVLNPQEPKWKPRQPWMWLHWMPPTES